VTSDRYRFGEQTRRGPLGSLRAGQAAVAVGGAGWAVAMIDLAPSGGGAVAALLGLAAAAVAASVPVAGLTLEQWAPVGAGWALARLRGLARWRRPPGGADGVVVALPARAAAATPRVIRAVRPAPPRELRDVRIVGLPYRGRTIGAVSERGGRRLTLVLVGRAPGFALADESEQQQRLAVWARC